MQSEVEDKRVTILIQQVKCCLLANGNIAFNLELIMVKLEKRAGCLPSQLHLVSGLIGIVLQDVHYVEGKELPPELTAALVARVSFKPA